VPPVHFTVRVTRAILVIVIPFLLEVALLIDWWPERARYRDLFPGIDDGAAVDRLAYEE
jgi:hypothetical protein